MDGHRLAAAPDFHIAGDAVIESVVADWRGTVPWHRTIKLLAQMIVMNARTGYVAMLLRAVPDLPFTLLEVPRHPEAERVILNAVTAWWAAYDRGEVAEVAAPSAIEAVQAAINHR